MALTDNLLPFLLLAIPFLALILFSDWSMHYILFVIPFSVLLLIQEPILGLPFIIAATLIWLYLAGRIGRNRMRNTFRIKAGSEIVAVVPKHHNFAAHYEVTVRFADGSWYRERMFNSWRGCPTFEGQLEDWQVNRLENAKAAAIKEHEKVAARKLI